MVGFLYEPPAPNVGHLQLFQNKMTNARGGMGTIGIGSLHDLITWQTFSKHKIVHFWKILLAQWLKEHYLAGRVTSIFPRYVRKEEATLPASSSSFDLPIIQLFGWVRQVLYWINQFYLCMHAYSGVLLTLSLSPRSITKQIAAASISCRNFEKIIWKMHPDSRLFWISNHVLSRFYLRERIQNPVKCYAKFLEG